MEQKFKYENGRFYLITNLKVWGENITECKDVTEELRPMINQFLSDEALRVIKNYPFDFKK